MTRRQDAEASLAMPAIKAMPASPASPPKADDNYAPSGRSSTQRAFVDDPLARRTNLALDLVRNTSALTEHVRRDRGVAM
jgi:hypothetical protein